MTKKKLDNVTLMVIDCVDYPRAKLAFDHCASYFDFGEAKILTHFDVDDSCVKIIPQISSIQQYNDFMIRNLADHFSTEFVLIAQWDGFIWNADMWDDDFLAYDYIGAAWPDSILYPGVPTKFNVGNGGFSIRSKRLQEFLKNDDNLTVKYGKHYAEDVIICQLNRAYLEKCGFTFAPKTLADKFSWECGPFMKAFGVHARIKLVKGST